MSPPLLSLLLLFSFFSSSDACMTTPQPTTTTPPFLCCQILTSSVVLKTPPTATIAGELLEQCSILRRISSQCGDEGILNCEAAPFTNPSTVFIQLFDVNGNKISEVRGTAQQANAALTCDHLTGQYTANGIVVARASCAQLTSTGSEAPDINVVGR